MLEDLDGVMCQIHGRNHMEHDVWAVLFCLWRAGLTLNIHKLGRVFAWNSPVLRTHCRCPGCPCWPREDKYYWIFSHPQKCSSTMVNQLGNFVLGSAGINAPLQQLLWKDSTWYWDEALQIAFQPASQRKACITWNPEWCDTVSFTLISSLDCSRKGDVQLGPYLFAMHAGTLCFHGVTMFD